MLEDQLTEKYERNLKRFENYLKYKTLVFHELKSVFWENFLCLTYDLHIASISISNFILERLLKNALIYLEVGISSIPIESWNTEFGKAEKYSKLNLFNCISNCEKNNLLTKDEGKYLNEVIRQMFRNGFSHADPDKILKKLDDEQQFYFGSINMNNSMKPVKLRTRVMPTFQMIYIESFSKQNSEYYYRYVYELMMKLESRLIVIKGNVE